MTERERGRGIFRKRCTDINLGIYKRRSKKRTGKGDLERVLDIEI